MAKHICLMSKTPKGRLIRDYFIRVENLHQAQTMMLDSNTTITAGKYGMEVVNGAKKIIISYAEYKYLGTVAGKNLQSRRKANKVVKIALDMLIEAAQAELELF